MESQDPVKLCELALQSCEAGRYSEARHYWEQALAIQRSRLPSGHPDIAAIQAELIGVYVHFQQYDEARKLLQQAVTEHRGKMSDSVRLMRLLLDHAGA